MQLGPCSTVPISYSAVQRSKILADVKRLSKDDVLFLSSSPQAGKFNGFVCIGIGVMLLRGKSPTRLLGF